jgi:hypothetical protein
VTVSFVNGKGGAIEIATAAANYYASQYAESTDTRGLASGAVGIVSGALGLAGSIWGAVNSTKKADAAKKFAVSIRNMTIYPIIIINSRNINKNDAINPIIQPTETANWPLRTGAIDNSNPPSFQARLYSTPQTCSDFTLQFKDFTTRSSPAGIVNLSAAKINGQWCDNPNVEDNGSVYHCSILQVTAPIRYFIMVSGVSNSSDAKVNICIVSDDGLV